jgi:hypothetical protein
MLLDAMRRAHLGYDKLLRVCRPDIEAIADIEDRKLRNEAYRVLRKKLQSTASTTQPNLRARKHS